MRHKREGLLAQIEAGVLDDTVPLSSLLQKCIVLGGQAGSEKMRDWARQELNGYKGDTEAWPDYRHIPAAVHCSATGHAAQSERHSVASAGVRGSMKSRSNRPRQAARVRHSGRRIVIE